MQAAEPDDIGFVLKDPAYTRLKFGVTTVLPGISTLYFTLGTIWGLPAVEQIIGTLAAFATFGGFILQKSYRNYNKNEANFAGNIIIHRDPTGKKIYSLELNGDPDDIDQRKTVTFTVEDSGTPQE